MASLYEQYLANNRDYLYNTVGKSADQAGGDAIDAKNAGLQYKQNADAAYDPLWNNEGGYGSQQQTDIIGADRLNGMQLSQQDQDSAYLTPDEQSGIKGDPSSRETYFNPKGDVSATQGDYAKSGSIADQGVGMSNAYADTMQGIADPTKLEQSADFVDRYRMTPEQVQAATTAAARDSSVVDQAAMDRVREAASASGMDPLGMASYMNRANRSSMQDAARAAATARVNAQQEQANRELQIETNRQGTEQAAENTQLGATAAGYGAKSAATTQQLNTQNQGNQALQQQRQYNTTTGTGLSAAEENQRTAAATTLANNRQATTLQNRNDVYDRSKYADTALATRTQTVGDAQRADAKEGRQYLTTQQQQDQAAQQADANRQMAGYGGVSQGVQSNLGLQEQNDQKPSWMDKLLSAGTQVGSAGLAAYAKS